MNKKVELGDIRIYGNLALGVLTEISNRNTALQFKFTTLKSLFMLEIEEQEFSCNYRLEDLCICDDKGVGWLCNQNKTFYVKLDWTNLENDTVAVKFHFITHEPSITLRRIHCYLPQKIALPAAGGTDVLMFPKASGMKITSPATEFFQPIDIKYATWKDRQLFVWKDGFQDINHIIEHYKYKSDASMGWLDYYCESGGLYLGSHDIAFDQIEAEVSADAGEPGINLGLIKTLNRHCDDYQTEFAIGVHKGDWHRGADIYRNFFDSTGRTVRKLPPFMRESPGIICHYDFKWQDKSINHRFEDIESIYDEAVEFGYNQILVAGWNKDGFDNSYPDFTPAAELGTQEELIKSVAKVNTKGGGVFFYINAHSFDMAAGNFEKSGSKWAVKEQNGDYSHEIYATSTLVSMCNSADGWREKVKKNIKYLINTIGARGVYIDQLNVIPKLCYDNSHNHDRSWKMNNVRILKEVRKELGPKYENKIFLFCEWATDGVVDEIDALLFQSCWYYSLKYSASEMFRYTFPEMAALEMIMQKPWPASPQDLEQTYVNRQFCKMYILGHIFWTYDHVPYTPGFKNLFIQAIKLRKRAACLFADGKFIDNINIKSCSAGIIAKSYELPDGNCFLCIWNSLGTTGKITLKTKKNISLMKIFTLTGDKEICINKPLIHLDCPESELSIIYLKRQKKTGNMQ